ncbi:MAG: helix-turn-helix domain-containing protein [Acidobacteriota bacterium]
MTKTEAAEELGIATRTLERYVGQGLLKPRYAKGARGKIAEFNEREVKALKKQLATREVTKLPQVPVHQKLMISLAEAAALTSLSKDSLEQAIEQGKLKVVKKDEKFYIKRKDLEAFVDKL